MFSRYATMVFGTVLFLIPTGAFAASDLVVAMQGPAQAARGQTITYAVTVVNNGPDQALQVKLGSSVPYDFLFEPNFSDSRCNVPYGSVSCDLGLMSGGTVTNLTLAFTVRPLTTLPYCSPLTADVSVSLSFSGTDILWNNNAATVRTAVPCPPPVECNDGIDNDRDGAIDFGDPLWGNHDFSCLSADDRDERYPEPTCGDGRDNDSDALIDFPWDPGCASRQDNDEWNPPPPSPPAAASFPPAPPPAFPLSPPSPIPYVPPSSSLPPSPSQDPPLPVSLVPQGRLPWLALPIPRCYNNVGPGYVEDMMLDLRCEGSKWGGGSRDSARAGAGSDSDGGGDRGRNGGGSGSDPAGSGGPGGGGDYGKNVYGIGSKHDNRKDGGWRGNSRDGVGVGEIDVLRRMPKTGVDLAAVSLSDDVYVFSTQKGFPMGTLLWILLAMLSMGGGGYVGWRKLSPAAESPM